MTSSKNRADRAVAPVVGIALLIAITVILAAVIGGVVLGIGVSGTDSPQATVSFSANGGGLDIIHEGGEPLPAGEVIVVTEHGTTLYELTTDLASGERIEGIDISGVEQGTRISVVWQDPASDTESILATFRL